MLEFFIALVARLIGVRLLNQATRESLDSLDEAESRIDGRANIARQKVLENHQQSLAAILGGQVLTVATPGPTVQPQIVHEVDGSSNGKARPPFRAGGPKSQVPTGDADRCGRASGAARKETRPAKGIARSRRHRHVLLRRRRFRRAEHRPGRGRGASDRGDAGLRIPDDPRATVVLTVENSRSWTFAPQVLAGLGAGCPKPFPPAVTYASLVEPRNQPMNDREMLQSEKPEDEAQGFHRSKTEALREALLGVPA